MTAKEEKVLTEIINYYNDKKWMPSIRYLKNKLGFKSQNSICQYLMQLENKGYLIRNQDGKLLLSNIEILKEKGIVNLKIINSNEKLRIELSSKKDYVGFKLKDDCFKKYSLLRGDYLIIEKDKKVKNGDLILVCLNKKYRVMSYYYQDGFYILNDSSEEVLYKINIIGKVVSVYRNI